jgi:hypothetical protein
MTDRPQRRTRACLRQRTMTTAVSVNVLTTLGLLANIDGESLRTPMSLTRMDWWTSSSARWRPTGRRRTR